MIDNDNKQTNFVSHKIIVYNAMKTDKLYVKNLQLYLC